MDSKVVLDSISVRHNDLCLRSPKDDDIASLMRVYSDDFNLSSGAQQQDRDTVRQRILDERIRGTRHAEDRAIWTIELVVEEHLSDLIGWAWLYPQRNDWTILESSSWVAPEHRGRGHSRTIREGVLALILDGPPS